jgi:hypothetical protein
MTIHAASRKKPPRGSKIPLEASYRHLAENPSHTRLPKVRVMVMDLPSDRSGNNLLKNTLLLPGGQEEISLRKCLLNSERNARAGKVFAALSAGGKSLHPARKIQAGDSSRQMRVGGLRQTGPGPHPQGGFGLPPRSVSPASYSMGGTGVPG